MKLRSKTLIVFGLLLFFASAVWCASLAAPGQALASVSGCSQTSGPMAMAGCDHPTFLCRFDLASHLLSHDALSSPRSINSLKLALGLAVGAPAINVSREIAPRGARECKNVSPAEPGKVSVCLFNSVLNL
jgi:hypothetical protein